LPHIPPQIDRKNTTLARAFFRKTPVKALLHQRPKKILKYSLLQAKKNRPDRGTVQAILKIAITGCS
jgi:hypothetical protein